MAEIEQGPYSGSGAWCKTPRWPSGASPRSIGRARWMGNRRGLRIRSSSFSTRSSSERRCLAPARLCRPVAWRSCTMEGTRHGRFTGRSRLMSDQKLGGTKPRWSAAALVARAQWREVS